jgi:hypothetical protein
MKLITRIGIAATAGATLALSSCAPGGRSPSGFLANYKQLDGGYGTANAVSSYVKPGVDLKKYDSVIIDPVTTITSAPGVSPAVDAQLAAYLSDSLHTELGKELKTASVPGPTTLRVRTALTNVAEGQKSAAPLATVHSSPKATLSGSLGSESVAMLVSHLALEGEIVDSSTGERLTALTDQRLGAKREASSKTSWEAVRSGVNQAVIRLNERFRSIRSH